MEASILFYDNKLKFISLLACLFEKIIAFEENRFSDNIQEVVKVREKQYELDQKLAVPRVMTNEEEITTGKARDVKAPEGAINGTPVSAGVIEGVARVFGIPEYPLLQMLVMENIKQRLLPDMAPILQAAMSRR